jgi:hypothetical protein
MLKILYDGVKRQAHTPDQYGTKIQSIAVEVSDSKWPIQLSHAYAFWFLE